MLIQFERFEIGMFMHSYFVYFNRSKMFFFFFFLLFYAGATTTSSLQKHGKTRSQMLRRKAILLRARSQKIKKF